MTRPHLVLVVACTVALQQDAVCRRFLLRSAGALLPGLECADDVPRLKASLLASIQLSSSGSPATNLSIPRDASAGIEALALQLELKRSVVTSDLVDGSWRLVYSNAPEITSLVSLPLGFELGPVFQPFNVSSGAFENQAFIGHKLGLARANTRVVGDFTPASGRRFGVDFRRVIFQLDSPFYTRKVVSLPPASHPSLFDNRHLQAASRVRQAVALRRNHIPRQRPAHNSWRRWLVVRFA